MAIQESVTVRNAKLDAIETAVGTSPILRFLSGAEPATCASAETGTQLANMTLPSDWMANASNGTKVLQGVWQDTSADNGGTLAYWRIYDSSGTTCHLQGTVTTTGSGGDITVSTTTITQGQPFQITSFTLTAGNA